MTTFKRFRVEINGEPYLLRSAIFACLAGDSRFDVVLAGANGASGDVVAHANPSSVGQAMPVVLTVAVDGPLRLECLPDGATRSIPYQGLRPLADVLVREIDNCTGEATEIDTPTTGIAVTSHA